MASIYVAQTGSDSTGAGTSGNPYATPGKAASVWTAGDIIYIKYSATPYSMTSSTANVAGGRVSLAPASDSALSAIIGYDTNATTTNTDTNRPTIQMATGSCSAITLAGYEIECRNVIVDCNSQTASTAFDNTGGTYGSRFVNCKAINFTAQGFLLAANNTLGAIGCEASSGTSSATSAFNVTGQSVVVYGCIARSNACPGFYADSNQGIQFTFCIADSNSGASSDGFITNLGTNSATNCTAYNSGRHGFYGASYMRSGGFVSCLSYGNGGYGFDTSGAGNLGAYLRNCAGGSNTSGNTNIGSSLNQGFVTLSADPFTTKASGDLSLNSTAGGGTACKAAGFPGVYPGGLTTGYLDIGAAQSQAVASGGGLLMQRHMTGGLV